MVPHTSESLEQSHVPILNDKVEEQKSQLTCQGSTHALKGPDSNSESAGSAGCRAQAELCPHLTTECRLEKLHRPRGH